MRRQSCNFISGSHVSAYCLLKCYPEDYIFEEFELCGQLQVSRAIRLLIMAGWQKSSIEGIAWLLTARESSRGASLNLLFTLWFPEEKCDCYNLAFYGI